MVLEVEAEDAAKCVIQVAEMMLMVGNPKVMGKFSSLSRTMHAVGWIATLVMAAAAAGMFLTWKN